MTLAQNLRLADPEATDEALWQVLDDVALADWVRGRKHGLNTTLGEFGATITFAGNLPGHTRTLPLATFQALESDPEAALALSLVLLAVSLVVLLPTRDRWLPTR